MIVDGDQRGGVRLPAGALEAFLEASRDGSALRAAGRRIGEALARGMGDDASWAALAASWAESGLGSLRRERPAEGLWLLRLDGPGGASPPGREFWEEVLAGLLGVLAGGPVGVAALPPAVGDEARFVAGAPEAIDRIRHGLSSGRTLERILEGA